jgi:hypothetical protein
MIAYVFWHWRKPDVAAAVYEKRQRDFHGALSSSTPAGFITSFSISLAGAPWANNGGETYEDWYLVDDFAALGALNQGAVSGSRAAPHDAAASVAGGGVAGIYALRSATKPTAPGQALWFTKPAGTTYAELLDRLAPVVEREGGALWMRQMTLGPAREFCIHGSKLISLPSPFEALTLQLRSVWP